MGLGFGEGLHALVLEDEAAIQLLLTDLLEEEGFKVTVAGTLAASLLAWQERQFDLVMCDKNLPDGNGMDLVRRVFEDSSETAVVVMTSYASIESAVEALRLNVSDYIFKPFEHIEKLREQLRRVVENLTLRRENRRLLEELRSKTERLEQLAEDLRQKNEVLEALATRDSLTGLFNHAFFQERLIQELERCVRYKHRLSLVFIDVDNFKTINDTLGHQVGDRVLKVLAEILQGQARLVDVPFRIRQGDIAARYGGDEFVLILPETDLVGSQIMAERLRAFVSQCHVEDLPGFTISVGLAALPEHGSSREALITAADKALYRSKSRGRNRVSTPDDAG